MDLIFTASDAKALAEKARSLIRSPAAFDGTLDAYAERYVLPNLPTAACVETFHEELVAFVRRPDPLFLLRAITGTTRKLTYSTRDGVRFKATDNAPAWWIHAVLAQGWRIAPGAFTEVMKTIPVHFFDIAPTCTTTANEAGFHIAHLFDVKDRNTDYASWSRTEVAARFVRNVHPCNYFLMAKPEWQRWGGDEHVLGFFGGLYAERYASVWREFMDLAMVQERHVLRDPGVVNYSYSPKGHASGDVTVNAHGERNRTAGPSDREGEHVEYRAARLTFKRDVIEPLAADDVFRVVTPFGVFEMTKEAMYRVFPGVPRSRSYREGGTYNYATLPKAAEQFRVMGDVAAGNAGRRRR